MTSPTTGTAPKAASQSSPRRSQRTPTASPTSAAPEAAAVATAIVSGSQVRHQASDAHLPATAIAADDLQAAADVVVRCAWRRRRIRRR